MRSGQAAPYHEGHGERSSMVKVKAQFTHKPSPRRCPAQQQARRRARLACRSSAVDSGSADCGNDRLWLPTLTQGSAKWLEEREGRLTASNFMEAVGLRWTKDGLEPREKLFLEKLGLTKKFEGNKATQHGQKLEPEALRVYTQLASQQIGTCGFVAWSGSSGREHSGVSSLNGQPGWLGCSPDAVVLSGKKAGEVEGWKKGDVEGALEVKCPFNQYYRLDDADRNWKYGFQVQGHAGILDVDWVDLMLYRPSKGGVLLVRYDKNEAFWNDMVTALEDLWFRHVVPAKLAMEEVCVKRPELLEDKKVRVKACLDAVRPYMPGQHALAKQLEQHARDMYDASEKELFSVEDLNSFQLKGVGSYVH